VKVWNSPPTLLRRKADEVAVDHEPLAALDLDLLAAERPGAVPEIVGDEALGELVVRDVAVADARPRAGTVFLPVGSVRARDARWLRTQRRYPRGAGWKWRAAYRASGDRTP
jgi:hypothetical protein